MAKIIKLVSRILATRRSIEFECIDRILLFFGFKRRQPRGGSSHFVYKHEEYKELLTIPKHKPLKNIYVQKVIDLLDLEEWYNENKR